MTESDLGNSEVMVTEGARSDNVGPKGKKSFAGKNPVGGV